MQVQLHLQLPETVVLLHDVEFRIDRGGTIIYPLGAPGPQPVTSFSTNSLQDGDIVYARVWTYDNGGGNALTNSITFDIDTFPGAIDFSSDALNNTICNDEMVSFTASSTVSTTLFQYFINGISKGTKHANHLYSFNYRCFYGNPLASDNSL